MARDVSPDVSPIEVKSAPVGMGKLKHTLPLGWYHPWVYGLIAGAEIPLPYGRGSALFLFARQCCRLLSQAALQLRLSVSVGFPRRPASADYVSGGRTPPWA